MSLPHHYHLIVVRGISPFMDKKTAWQKTYLHVLWDSGRISSQCICHFGILTQGPHSSWVKLTDLGMCSWSKQTIQSPLQCFSLVPTKALGKGAMGNGRHCLTPHDMWQLDEHIPMHSAIKRQTGRDKGQGAVKKPHSTQISFGPAVCDSWLNL